MRRVVFSKGAAVITAGLLAAGLMAASAAAATSATSGRAAAGQQARRSAAASHARIGLAPSAPAPAKRWLLADQRAYAAQRADGAITGIAQAANAAPLEGICVTATGPSGHGLGVTLQDGRFLIAGLRPGSYSLEYRDCGHPGRFLQQWYGGTMTQAGSRSVLVSGPGLVPVAPVTLRRPASSARQLAVPASAADPGRALLARVLAAVSAGGPAGRLTSLAPANGGRISGRVTDQRGHPLAGICVEAGQVNGNGFTHLATGRRGFYLTAKLPPGRYVAFFYPGCGNTGNWLPQVYKDSDNLLKPTVFAVRAGKTAANINAVLRPGGEISGMVTNAAGQKLSGVCVVPTRASSSDLFAFVQPTVSRRGTFHVRSIPPGVYVLFFFPCRPGSVYASVWWKNSATQRRARLIRVKAGQRVSGISQVIPVGGKITGVVTAGTSSGPRLAGICVLAGPVAGGPLEGEAVTRADGTYVVRGLAPGRYQVQFSPGCSNNGNYLPETYPSLVTVAYGRVHAGINGVLPLGAEVSGVVTDSRGHPIGGICVEAARGPGFGAATFGQTAANGSYAIGQLDAGTYTVQFMGGCGNPGSYAPQGYNGTNVNTPQLITLAAAQQRSGINAVMRPGATISGRVTSVSGTGLGGVCVIATTPGIVASSGSSGGLGELPGALALGFAATTGGRYRIPNLQPGQYQVSFLGGCGSKGDLAAQWYSARRGAGPPAIIDAGARHPTAGIDVVLQAGGAISGITRSASGRGLPGVCVVVTSLNPNVRLPLNQTVPFGSRYQLSGLVPGAYHVTFIPGCFGLNYATQWYSRKPSPAGAARVIVRAGQTTTGINAALTPGGSITGLVTSAATRAPVGGICVVAQNVAQEDDFGFDITTRQGRYVIPGLNSGRYEIEFFPCFGSLAGQVRSSLVTVAAPRQTGGINAALGAGGSIQGHVTARSPATPGQGLCVDAFGVTGGFANSAITDASGSFSIPNLPPGRYVVYVGDPACPDGPYNVVPQWYPGKRSRAGATPVTVAGGMVTSGIDANLALDGSITGSVTGPGGAPLTGVCVSAVGLGRGAAPVVAVTAGGGYRLGDLTPGRYRVEFSSGCGAAGYATQWWKNASSAATATIITVTADATVTGISAALRR